MSKWEKAREQSFALSAKEPRARAEKHSYREYWESDIEKEARSYEQCASYMSLAN